MKKAGVIGLGLLILLIGWTCPGLSYYYCAFAEDITITTYYPSPYGVYQEMRSERMAVGNTYYDSSQHCWLGGPCAIPDIDANADLIVEDNVGIGTVSPQLNQDGRVLQLDVAENIVAKDIYLDNPRFGVARWASQTQGGTHFNLDLNDETTASVGLPAGTYFVTAFGRTIDAGKSASYWIGVNFEGLTRDVFIQDHPDGTPEFSIPAVVTVNDGTLNLLSSNCFMYGVSGFKIPD